MNTPPVLFLIFNRPDLTEQSFQEIRKARPRHLFVAADGPRNDRSGEAEACQQARAIVEQIDWPCEVQTLFRDENLGCREAVSGAITWFFEHVEEGIILEDDCVPDQSFFDFCGELLERYRGDRRVMCVTGDNFQQGQFRGDASYYFSAYPHCWGWASWRRAWDLYDGKLECLEQVKTTQCLFDIHRSHVARHWERIFDKVLCQEIDTWAYVWQLSCWANSGLTCTPNQNLVANIGFDDRATHTVNSTGQPATKAEALDAEILHPTHVLRNSLADEFVEDSHFKIGQPRRTELPAPRGPRQDLLRIYQSLRGIARRGFRNIKPLPIADVSGLETLKTKPRYEAFSILLGGKTLSGPDGPSAYYSHREIFCDKIYNFESDKRSPRIIDCGANIGLSVIYFRSRFPKARITCVEADPFIAQFLSQNLTSHGVSDVEIIGKAVAATDGEIRFSSEGADAGRIVDSGDQSAQTLSCCTLDSMIDGPVDMLKIDIEGAETEAILACTKLDQVERMFVEYHSFPDRPQDLDALLAHAKSFGFRYIIRHQFASKTPFTLQKRQGGMDLQLNIFFCKEK